MRITKYALLATLVGCALPNRPEPKSWVEHQQAADAHDQRAAEHDRAASAHAKHDVARYQCGDLVAADQATSGGEPLAPSIPCWDPEEETYERHRTEAQHERVLAHQERVAAATLVREEEAACKTISQDEQQHSAFAHHKEIAEIVPHYVDSKLRGARIVFKPVLGLTAEWLKEDIACHTAHFHTTGEDPNYMPDDPTLVPGAVVSVQPTSRTIEVVVEGDTDEAGQESLGRAQALQMRPSATTARR
jgi:hypothetical protein